jgi:hypothetical protein
MYSGALRAVDLSEIYTYHEQILDELARHGLKPLAFTAPIRLRDAVRDLYKYEIKRLRDRLLAGLIAKHEYAGHVVELRKRYWLLSIPTALWTIAPREGADVNGAKSS